METPKIILLSIAGLIALSMTLFGLQFLTKRFKHIEVDGKPNLSFSLWFISLFISAIIIQTKVIELTNELIDVIKRISPAGTFFDFFKSTTIFIGLGLIWLVVWIFISKYLCVIIFKDRNDLIEMERDNFTYFAVRGVVLIGLVYSFSTVFEILLRFFMPSIDIPFYR
jgi:hypothetical protein